MRLLNFAHPLTADHRHQLAALGVEVQEITEIPAHLDNSRPLAPQIVQMVNTIGLTPQEWQTAPLVINLPGYAPAVAALLAELHGRMGHFATIIRLRPVAGATPTQYEIAEVINLQAVRDQARSER